MKAGKLAIVRRCFVRNGATIYDKEGKPAEYKSINIAKRIPRELQTKGLGRGQVIAWR